MWLECAHQFACNSYCSRILMTKLQLGYDYLSSKLLTVIIDPFSKDQKLIWISIYIYTPYFHIKIFVIIMNQHIVCKYKVWNECWCIQNIGRSVHPITEDTVQFIDYIDVCAPLYSHQVALPCYSTSRIVTKAQ